MLFEDDARQRWDLDRLYTDMGQAKPEVCTNRPFILTETEQELLCGLLLGLNPTQISDQRHSGSVTPYLSDTVYRYAEQLTDRERNSLGSWRDIVPWLEEAGYREQAQTFRYWGEMPEVTTFYGRKVELDQLRRRVLTSACRVVSIIGHAGMGKTSLTVKLVNTVRDQFPGGGIWQSLRYAPSLEDVLGQWLTHMPDVMPHSDSWYDQLNAVMGYLRGHRCLVVIDNLESILDNQNLEYKADYSPYRELFKRLGEDSHHSCVVVTSRDRIPDMYGFTDGQVQRLDLQGLDHNAASQLLEAQGLTKETKSNWLNLTDIYRGNPLMLKTAAQHILELFDGDVGDFLRCAKTMVSGGLRALVGKLFHSLSQNEQELLKQLVLYNGPMPITDIQEPKMVDAMSTLLSRCLIEKSAASIMPIPVLIDYIQNYIL